jgi:hypothetical protein
MLRNRVFPQKSPAGKENRMIAALRFGGKYRWKNGEM